MRRGKTSVRVDRVESVWDEWVAAFLLEERDVKGRRPRTIELHRENFRTIRGVLDAVGAPADPASIGRGHIVAAIGHLRELGKEPRTINLKIQSLRQLYAFGREDGRYTAPENPLARIPKQREAEKPPKSLHDDEVRRLLRQPDVRVFSGLRDRAMILVLLDTGIRLAEILQLRLDDVDLDHRSLHISAKSKTHAERTVYLCEETAKTLRIYLKERGALATDVVFVSRDEKPLHRKTFQSRVADYGTAVGVTVSPHRLRHTFARMYLANGGDAVSLQQALGHRDLAMVRLYARLWGSDLQKLHDRYSPLRRLEPGT